VATRGSHIDKGVGVAEVLFRAYADLAGVLGDALEADVGIPLPWYAVLRSLAGAARGHLKMSELGRAISMTSGGVTRLVDRVAAAGYVERVAHPSDRRVSHVTITDAGRRMLRRAEPVYRRNVEAHLVGRLDPDELHELDRIVRKLTHD
jgi:MarR family 2-MHQ and catechol resistance regulon transcriptional repressor